MTTYLDNLIATQNNIGALLAQVTANPQPNYSLDGESYSWADYVSMLRGQLRGLQTDIQDASGPFEVNSISR